jgi:hypothetical protein
MPKFSGFRGYCEKADMVAAVRSYATGWSPLVGWSPGNTSCQCGITS